MVDNSHFVHVYLEKFIEFHYTAVIGDSGGDAVAGIDESVFAVIAVLIVLNNFGYVAVAVGDFVVVSAFAAGQTRQMPVSVIFETACVVFIATL